MMNPKPNTRTDTAIRSRLDGWAAAIRAKDAEAVLSFYVDDPLVFDLAPPLRRSGKPALRRALSEWFPTFEGPVGWDLRDLDVAAGDELAFCSSLVRIGGTRTDGEETDVWARLTICLRNVGGEWMLAHEHSSTPFYMDGSLKAAVDLEP